MLIAERLESERLRQIIREFQRHRFGRRAESLAEDQLQLALEDAEQEAASGQAEAEQKNPAERQVRSARRRTNRATPTSPALWITDHATDPSHRPCHDQHSARTVSR